jgi:DNA-binding transcriptional MocR family regulator
MIVGFCAAGRLVEHTTRVQDAYRAHRDRMVAAFQRDLPEITFDVPQGGYYLWLTLPAGVDGDALAQRAGDAGVTIISGSKFFARTDGEHPKNRARVAFSHATIDEIDEGVRRLTAAYHSLADGVTVMERASS